MVKNFINLKVSKSGKSDMTVSEEECKLFYEISKKNNKYKSYQPYNYGNNNVPPGCWVHDKNVRFNTSTGNIKVTVGGSY